MPGLIPIGWVWQEFSSGNCRFSGSWPWVVGGREGAAVKQTDFSSGARERGLAVFARVPDAHGPPI